MSPDEYRELVDFLGRKFDRIDQRFDQVDQRFEQVDQRFERLEGEISGVQGEVRGVQGEVRGMQGEVRGMQAGLAGVQEEVRALRVLEEENAKQIRRVAEGVTTNGERLERFQAEVRQEFTEVRQEMKWGFDAIHARVDQVKTARRR